MKKIKILLLLLTVSVAGFYSCTDNDPVENEIVTSKSISLRATLNEIKKANNINGKNELATQDQAFCFNFVFPINLSYNNGTVVTVSSYEGLIAVLASETSTFYFEGIQFPFQVQQEGTIFTIDDEAEFFALILECNFLTVNNFVFDFILFLNSSQDSPKPPSKIANLPLSPQSFPLRKLLPQIRQNQC